MSWGCGLCQLLAGGALLALLVQLVRWLRADGDLTLLWAEWRGKKPGKAGPRERPPAGSGRQPGGRLRGAERWRRLRRSVRGTGDGGVRG